MTPTRVEVVEILIDHLLAIQERDTHKTELTWPDQSDIYTETYRRLCVVFDVEPEERP